MQQALKTVLPDDGEKGVHIREALVLVLHVCHLLWVCKCVLWTVTAYTYAYYMITHIRAADAVITRICLSLERVEPQGRAKM